MEWVEYHNIEPWGSKFDDSMHGQFCALYANCHRDPKTRPEPFTQRDFMLTAELEPERELTDEEVDAQIGMILGG